MNLPCRALALAGAAAAFAVLCGCATETAQRAAGVSVARAGPHQPGLVSGAGVDSRDLASVTDALAESILEIPEISEAARAPHIVLEPLTNVSGFPIDKDIFLIRIRVLLNSKAMNKVRFLDRAMMARYEEQQKMGASVIPASARLSTPAGEPRGADYALSGRIEGAPGGSSAGGSETLLYSLRLTDARTNELIWENAFEMKRQVIEEAVFR